MDTGKGIFETVNANSQEEFKKAKRLLEKIYPDYGGWFREGEILEIKGSTFRVKRIKPTEIVLKLVKRSN